MTGLCGVPTAARADSLVVEARGTIATSCSLFKSQNGDFAQPNLSANGSISGQATVKCNSGFRITATSANGALTNSKSAANFTSSVAYTFGMSVPVDDGATVTSTPSQCSSTAMKSGTSCVLMASGKTATGVAGAGRPATLTLAYTVPSLPTRLLAGTYSDTITLTIAASQ
jgi:hypothetical protein